MKSKRSIRCLRVAYSEPPTCLESGLVRCWSRAVEKVFETFRKV